MKISQKLLTARVAARDRFAKLSGLRFKNSGLLETAFTHRSFLNEARIKGEHNERLEFLGDAVLELAVTDLLFRAYPNANEGELTSYRAALVNAGMLGSIAKRLGVNECLRLSKGEAKDTGRARLSILANTFEAIIGALYLDRGFAAVLGFVEREVMPHLKGVMRGGTFRDAKSRFQEFAQEKYGITPSYQTISAEGPDHARTFVVSVSIGDVVLSHGSGMSKQEAEQDAARKALARES